MGKFIDLTGKRFGRWTVLSHTGTRGGKVTGQSMWHCRCDCGTEKPAILYGALTSGASSSCGCYRRERLVAKVSPGPNTKTHFAEYTIWLGIKTRCLNVNHPSYRHYGAKGITVCDEWRTSFKTFLADMGPKPFPEASVERKNNKEGYHPGNCIWATRSEQMSNTKRTRNFTWNGKRMCLTAIARMENVRYASLYQYTITQGTPMREAVDRCKARGLTFLERAVEFGGDNHARITNQKRVRSRPIRDFQPL